MIVVGADASNAFAEAPSPKAPLYVVVDQQFREWWRKQGKGEIPKGYVMKVKHALQDHPESPRLWAKMIDEIIRTHVGLQPTSHEQCLYERTIDGEKVLFLRQVDDFAVACKNVEISNKVIDLISAHLSAPMKHLGIIDRFNGIDIDQTQDYIKVHNKTLLAKILKSRKWYTDTEKQPVNPLPMRDDNAYIKILDTAQGPVEEDKKQELEDEMGFSYRGALGEALFAMITCRPDISFAIIKLSKFANSPAREHYVALKKVFRYLRATIDDEIIYWRPNTNRSEHLKQSKAPLIYHQHSKPLPTIDKTQLIGSVDSDWAADLQTRKSVSGIVMHMAGGAVHYKTKFQEGIAHSSTEAEFVAACDTAKIALYLRSILDGIGIPQHEATALMEDNDGALMMANAGQPTRRTRHMDIKYFGIQDWVEDDLVILEAIHTSNNSADHLTKALSRTAFYKHNDVTMGRIQPQYYKGELKPTYRSIKNTNMQQMPQLENLQQ